MSVTILDHALIQHKLTIMRDKNTSTYIFKQNLDEIAKLMAFEVTRNVSLKIKQLKHLFVQWWEKKWINKLFLHLFYVQELV